MKHPGDEESERVINLSDWKRISTDFATMELARASQLQSGKENQRCLRFVAIFLAISIAAIGMIAVSVIALTAIKGDGNDTQKRPAEPARASKADPNPSQGAK